jgi:hypothetical protein
MYLIQLLLPLHDNDKRKFPPDYLATVRKDLMECFGGVTAFLRSPAVGLWKEGNDEVNRDEVVMFEVMTDQLMKTGGRAIGQNCRINFVKMKY